MKKLEIKNLSKSFGAVQALQDINLSIEDGQMLAVLGPSGCGKTTLLRSITGFETPDCGEIYIDGKPVFNDRMSVRPEKRHIGYVPQEGVLFPHLSVEKNITFGLSRKEKSTFEVDEMLELVGMAGLGQRMPHQLSGGQQQRVALARALAPRPTLVLLDEPFSVLDAELRVTLREEVKILLNKIGATSILVTHDQEEALSMADLVAVMRRRTFVQTADPVSLYKYPVDIKVAEFVGETTTIKAEVSNGVVRCLFGDLSVVSGCPRDCPLATVMIRPEQFTISKPNVHVNGTITRTVFYGHDALIYVKLDEEYGCGEIQIRTMGSPEFVVGDSVGLEIKGQVMAYPHEYELAAG